MDEVLIIASDQLDDDEFLVMAMIADEENPEVRNYNRLELTSLTDEEIEKKHLSIQEGRSSPSSRGTSVSTGTYNRHPSEDYWHGMHAGGSEKNCIVIPVQMVISGAIVRPAGE